MMPELGRYAFEVITAYLVSLAMLAALVGWVWLRAAQVRKQLERTEKRQRVKRNV